MIVAYAQAIERQGVDAAIDGRAVDVENTAFMGVRQKSKALNLKPAVGQADRIVVHLGLGVVRLQIDSSETEDVSRVVIVVPVQALRLDRDQLSRAVLQTAAAIDRHLDQSDVATALSLAAHLAQDVANRRMLAVGSSLALAALGLTALVACRRKSQRK